jgi:BirA family transcriptional regulator, biotin operon repressor / biotin---[acetyl-CoA-carboxylase] ligase
MQAPGVSAGSFCWRRKRASSLYTFDMKITREDAALQTGARLGRALVALQQSGGAIGSADWAAAAGVKAGEAWKLAEGLRALGVEVGGSAAEGWRLAGEADLALPEVLEPKIAETIFAGGVRHFISIGSTNAAAMQAGAERWAESLEEGTTGSQVPHSNIRGLNGAPGVRGEVWLAEEQTAGKGRAGHGWESRPRDGIYLSALLRPKLAPAEVIVFSLAAGLAVVEAVHEVTGLWSDLRWPNDVMVGERKFCGILTELNAEVTRVRYVVVGMGLNVNNAEFPAELEAIATSLCRETGRRVSRVELVAALLRALDREQAALAGGAAGTREAARQQVLRRFERHSSYCCGAAVTVEEDGGYQGVTCGLDERGFLRVETADGMRTVLSGGVRKR